MPVARPKDPELDFRYLGFALKLHEERLSELDDFIEAKRAKITALQRLKKSLMQNLLIGRMRLSLEAIAELKRRKFINP